MYGWLKCVNSERMGHEGKLQARVCVCFLTSALKWRNDNVTWNKQCKWRWDREEEVEEDRKRERERRARAYLGSENAITVTVSGNIAGGCIGAENHTWHAYPWRPATLRQIWIFHRIHFHTLLNVSPPITDNIPVPQLYIFRLGRRQRLPIFVHLHFARIAYQ